MSDEGRKGVTDQISDKVTPDSQKSTLDKAQEGASGLYDRAAGAVQPEDQKSGTQKVADSARGGSDDAENQTKGIFQSASDTLGSTAQSVSDTLQGKK